MKKVSHKTPKVKTIRQADTMPETRTEETGRTGYTYRIDPGPDSLRIRRRGRRIAE